jgi:hypothetical protein
MKDVPERTLGALDLDDHRRRHVGTPEGAEQVIRVVVEKALRRRPDPRKSRSKSSHALPRVLRAGSLPSPLNTPLSGR